MGSRGRPTDAALRRTRELIERLHLSGYSSDRIREELLALKDDPIDLQVGAIKRHISLIRREWAMTRPEDLESTRRDLIGHYQAVMFEAARGAAARRGTALEIGQNKLRIEAAKELAKLLGLDVKRVELTGAHGAPLVQQMPPHPVESLSNAEYARRHRLYAEDFEALADAAEADEEGAEEAS